MIGITVCITNHLLYTIILSSVQKIFIHSQKIRDILQQIFILNGNKRDAY